MELTRCRICGEVYYGSHISHCPFCGAHGSNLVPIHDWKDEDEGVKLTSEERRDLAETKDLEFENTRFYRSAVMSSKSDAISGFFKYLAKIENEHYNLACKLLGEEKDSAVYEPSNDKGNDLANLEESREKEEHASKLYEGFVKNAKSERVKRVFQALSEVEGDHMRLDDEQIKIINNVTG